MIISRSYFKGNIHVPNANDTAPNSNLLGNGNSLDFFIEEYERDVLLKCLGHSLLEKFKNELDSSNSNGLKSTSDSKWNDLLNGKEYQIDGELVKWRGLIFKEGKLERSLIAYYVYYHFLRDDIESYNGTGVQSEESKNSQKVSPIPKAVKAWRSFYNLTVGNFNTPQIIYKNHGIGIDWVNHSSGIRSLYQFITDMNNIRSKTYPNWQPHFFENLNQFGI